MSTAWLKTSLALWRRRLTYRRAKHRQYHTPGSYRPEAARVRLAVKWHKLEDEAAQMVARREHQLAQRSGPRIITAAQLGLRFQYLWGSKGYVTRGAWHYTAGPRAPGATRLIELVRTYHRMHGGGLAYEAVIADDGTIALINPMNRKGAAVASSNTGMVNICCPGTTGDRLTEAQERSVRWLRDNWHTRSVPSAHRLPRGARALDWRGHREHPGQSTACPGAMLTDYKECWR